MGKFSRIGNELYNGRRSFDFVSKRGLWYAISTVLVVLSFGAIFIKGLNFGIEFTGGTQYRVPVSAAQNNQETADQLREAVANAGVAEAESPTVTTAGGSLLLQVEEMTSEEADQITDAILTVVDVPRDDIAQSEIGASWGEEVAKRAVIGVAVFLVLVLIFIGFYFREWKMSIAAFVALFHDVVITMGVYALSGFQVTPSAVTGLLAILGFSLYDTVVVFDKVRENTAAMRTNRQTYAQASNLAVNQTLVRSINTGIVALIPIGAILWVSAVQLGASSLQDLALSQFVGMAVGVYSSVFLAPRVLVHMKAGEDEVKLAERRAKARERAQADRYAAVPVFTDDMAVEADVDDPDGFADGEDEDSPRRGGGSFVAPGRRDEATGRGRTVPEARGPIGMSNSAGRQQPSRQTRSKRGKK
ncbi:protein translocase subunit SecF [Nocardioides sp. R-C-SC26]|uniref:protein translocase subunit SecF n=1 Tax=Nocardioides sp. R-C-SC26 TaxID=2870414 RepID=UPI001E5020FE|nr:protein translocase subunit SecF [Nocardioides sp. R-C-SC26]